MTDLDLGVNAILVPVLLVIGLQIIRRHRRLSGKLPRIHHHVLNFAFLGDGVRVGLLVALVIGLQLGVRRLNALGDIVFLEHRVIELDLGVFLDEFLVQIGVGYGGSSRDQGFQLALQNFVFNELLELRDGEIVARDEVFVGRLANELALGEQHRGKLAVLKLVGNFFVGGV